MLCLRLSVVLLPFFSSHVLSLPFLGPCDEVVVTSVSGTYTGIITDIAPHVRQFLKMPYALSPTESRRWLPPIKPSSNSGSTYDATTFPPSCPQYVSRVPTVQSQDVPEFQIFTDSQGTTAGASAAETSEDCLYLAVWTPAGLEVSNLPVIMFITGGGFLTGGINIPYQLPHHWVERTQAHIVVTINYRLNIMGFPDAAGLEIQNIGLLDQRMALEWVRDNIAAFRGNPSRIMLWGQSAGADSVDFQNFAFPNDPIASSFYMSSGNAYQPIVVSDSGHKNFSFVATHFGCAGLDSSQELDCMRTVPSDDLQNFVGQYMDNFTLVDPTLAPLRFNPTADEVLVFSNYTERYEKGLVADRPAIVSTTTNEGVVAVPYPGTPGSSAVGQPPNQTVVDFATLLYFLRPALNLTTYRIQYAGNFSNVSPRPWLGAYHLSDLPPVFGTHGDFRGSSTPEEVAVSESMQNNVFMQMQDPTARLEGVEWPSYKEGGALVFGLNGTIVQRVSVSEIDNACAGFGI
ncbi:alpha/beta-hydrolase [Hyaloscypha bicolor E]|uniref:Carboxylic ester hydrolase n=1 Tax=Hyaloscypha bicolor E TaxID=1095630 RepID=A0A2J6SS45_9HELO|nr:alpha/beta-hydrolase [Hyaloscypha bicolor E]PMD53596.1 alpha/beta-hydrolase [Hyaloscypha bicolor E]